MASPLPKLADAHEALARGRLGRALGRSWDAALIAVNARDVQALEAVRALALQIEEQAGGGKDEEAHRLAAYCSACIDDLRAGVRHDSFLGGMLRRS